MSVTGTRLVTLAAALLLVGAGGCTQSITYSGYVADESLTSAIAPGVDNRASVQGTLGRPTFQGQFDQRDWYYVSRQTRQFAFGRPKAASQSVLHVRFDDAGNVQSVERTGLEQIASVSPTSRTTPTLGRDRSFFDEIFGNIGRVGAPGMGGANNGSNTGTPN
jgi:outer membrane protein assembly factor BamE (lipoprotein component of BamABCDE complex)